MVGAVAMSVPTLSCTTSAVTRLRKLISTTSLSADEAGSRNVSDRQRSLTVFHAESWAITRAEGFETLPRP